ncbi:MAG: Arm DNA-binding domain-containing protein, partial [Planctomycetota bacterium]|nr:Arm DNA-binding domain-containing protein [Planctomycetota bacterium]
IGSTRVVPKKEVFSHMVKKPSTISRFSFTISKLMELPAPTSGRVYHYDTKVAGLCLCVTKTGAKSFYFYRKIDGRPERIRLGSFPEVFLSDARDAAREMVGEIAKGRDPAAERRARREAPTLKELFDHWWKNHSKPHKKSWKNDERLFKKYFPTLSGKRLTAIRKADVRAWHTRLGKQHGPYQANRA